MCANSLDCLRASPPLHAPWKYQQPLEDGPGHLGSPRLPTPHTQHPRTPRGGQENKNKNRGGNLPQQVRRSQVGVVGNAARTQMRLAALLTATCPSPPERRERDLALRLTSRRNIECRGYLLPAPLVPGCPHCCR